MTTVIFSRSAKEMAKHLTYGIDHDCSPKVKHPSPHKLHNTMSYVPTQRKTYINTLQSDEVTKGSLCKFWGAAPKVNTHAKKEASR